jgi:probable HAF family extracellular repeat protein
MSGYNMQVLENLLGTGDVSVAAINSTGQVVGRSATGASDGNGNPISHAFLYQNGAVTDLGTLGGEQSEATDINDAGDIVGFSDTGAVDGNGIPVSCAFLYRQGKMTSLVGTLGGASSQANAINSSGVVVGEAYTNEKDVYGYPITLAVQWTSNNNGNVVMTNLGSLNLGTSSSALGINDNGAIVGLSGTSGDDNTGFLIPPGGKMTKLNCAYAGSINSSGAMAAGKLTDYIVDGNVVGHEFQPQALKAGGGLIPTAKLPNEPNSAGFSQLEIAISIGAEMYSINGNGFIVGANRFNAHDYGYYFDNQQEYYRALLWRPYIENASLYPPQDLNDYVNQIDPNWYLQAANDINFFGQIVGNRFKVGIDPSSPFQVPGSTSGFILTPDNTPGPALSRVDRFAYLYILAGILGGGPGIVHAPGGPLHIWVDPGGPDDPGPTPTRSAASVAKHDILVALAIDEAAQLIASPTTRLDISRAALSVVQRSAARLVAGIQIKAAAPMPRSSLRAGGVASPLNRRFRLHERTRTNRITTREGADVIIPTE